MSKQNYELNENRYLKSTNPAEPDNNNQINDQDPPNDSNQRENSYLPKNLEQTNMFIGTTNELEKKIAEIKQKFLASMGKPIVGNLIDDTKIANPDEDEIRELYNQLSSNHLHRPLLITDIDINENEEEKSIPNTKFILSHEELYREMNNQIKKDIKNNQFEITVLDQIFIESKHFDKYEKIKKIIPQEDIIESFLYCSKLQNQKNKPIISDNGFYGKGIYATDNLFYASIYSNGYRKLDINDKTSILCCRVIYNKSKVKNLTDLSNAMKPVEDDIKFNYGINRALVGSSSDYHPIDENEIENNYIYAHEYVFSNKYQIIPLCQLEIMRKDHFILWKDENIDKGENSAYLKQLAIKMDVNVYNVTNNNDALNVIRKKKHAQVKLITNGGNFLNGKKLIENARSITKSNFVCLVFAHSQSHMEWVSQMENVLFTTNSDDFKKFAALQMNSKDILDFTSELTDKYDYQFKINEKELLNFPLV